MISVCHSIVEILQSKSEKIMDILQTLQQRNILLYACIYNLYFVHNTISTPYFHRQKNSTTKKHTTKTIYINYNCKQITAIHMIYTLLI